MPEDGVLDDLALGRALLARQHLLVRTRASVTEVVEHLLGLQAQNPWSPFLSLWSRVEGFTTADLDGLLLDRVVLRIAAMRSTVHLVTARDAPVLAELARPAIARELSANARRRASADATDLDALADLAGALLRERPRLTTDLGTLLAERWPGAHPQDLAAFARALLPLVQVTPRGLWRRSAATAWTTLDAWVPDEAAAAGDLLDPAARTAALERVVLRYLAAFGPATPADVQAWSGLTCLAPVLDGLRDRLVVLTATPARPGGRPRTLLDLPDAPRPDPGTPAPARLLPDFDNLWLAHARRTRIVDDAHRLALQTRDGRLLSAALVDGRIRASWTLDRSADGRGAARRSTATLRLMPLGTLTAAETDELVAEAERAVAFLADDADARHVVVER